MTLKAEFGARRGGFSLEFSAVVARGETLAVVGESGAGKTTALRCIAGLLTPTRGRISMDDRAWCECATRAFVPAYRRDVGMAFQGGALFGHLTALENVAFGLRARGWRARKATARAREALRIAEAEHLSDRRASTLSGGEGQRVAIARAIAPRPAVLLLDEPMTGLDLNVRAPVRDALRRAIEATNAATILVTHEPSEALRFARRFVVLGEGRVIQSGDLAQMRERPASPYVASFALGDR